VRVTEVGNAEKANGDRGSRAIARIPGQGVADIRTVRGCAYAPMCIKSIERSLRSEVNVLDGQRGVPQPIRFRSARCRSSTGLRERLTSDSRPGRLLVNTTEEDKDRSNEWFQAGCDNFQSRRPSHSVLADMLGRRRCDEEVSSVRRCGHRVGHTGLRWKTLPLCGSRRRAEFCKRRNGNTPARARVGQGVRVS
jgi:hypothetical protein